MLPAPRFVLALAVVASGACMRPAPELAPRPILAAPVALVPAAESSVAALDTAALRMRQLMVPVDGAPVRRVQDSFNERRDGGRTHRAVDILAPRGTPVVSADEGRVYRIRSNASGGLTIYAVDPEERFVYYYAHLDHYRDGLSEGTKLAKGEVIGYVGTTGNAPRDTPHLHFQVMRMTAGKKYWDGVPLDPYPFFALDGKQQR